MLQKVVLLLLPLFVAACADSVSAPAAPTQQAAPLATLPDFTPLVKAQGAAVVNISTTNSAKMGQAPGQAPGPGQGPGTPGPGQGPGIPFSEDDPFFEFFKRFMPPEGFERGPRPSPGQSLGSGFIISKDGYILTNAHVVANADEVTVALTDKREFKAKVIGLDRRTDVAVLKIDAADLPTLKLGNTSDLQVGEWVVAIGSPFGFENSVTAGIVSAKGRSLSGESYVPFIQTDVAVNPGNSGGPLFNLKGEVVGINSQIYSRTGGYQGVSFAIPIEIAMNISDQLRTDGKVSRGRLGVVIQPLTAQLAKSFGREDPAGALVASIEKGSPAEKAGLQAGDVIVQFNSKKVQDSRELPLMVATSKPGATVPIQVWRKGESKEFKVTLGELPPLEPVASAKGDGQAPATVDKLGLALSNLTQLQQQALKTDHGVMVENATGAAAKAGIRKGDVILGVQDKNVSSVEEFNKLVSEADKGDSLALLVKREDSTIFIPVTVG
ncbi:MAG: DegQ family serine endoprotease [Burkholderiales bacterium]